MQSFVFGITVDGNSVTAVIRTDLNKGENFTVMYVVKPAEISDDKFPFKKGDVMTVSDVVKFAAVSKQNGDLDISVVALEEGDSKVNLEIPEFKQVTISVTNEGATLTINGEVVEGQEWSDQVEKGKSVSYKAGLEGYTTQEDTLTVGDEDITEEITLVEA